MKRTTKKEMEKEMVCKHCIVKRKGRTEEFDERKIYSTCYSAALSAGLKHMEAEEFCEKVCKEVRVWAHTKAIMTSEEIFKKTIEIIKKHNHKVAFMYETHRDVS